MKRTYVLFSTLLATSALGVSLFTSSAFADDSATADSIYSVTALTGDTVNDWTGFSFALSFDATSTQQVTPGTTVFVSTPAASVSGIDWSRFHVSDTGNKTSVNSADTDWGTVKYDAQRGGYLFTLTKPQAGDTIGLSIPSSRGYINANATSGNFRLPYTVTDGKTGQQTNGTVETTTNAPYTFHTAPATYTPSTAGVSLGHGFPTNSVVKDLAGRQVLDNYDHGNWYRSEQNATNGQFYYAFSGFLNEAGTNKDGVSYYTFRVAGVNDAGLKLNSDDFQISTDHGWGATNTSFQSMAGYEGITLTNNADGTVTVGIPNAEIQDYRYVLQAPRAKRGVTQVSVYSGKDASGLPIAQSNAQTLAD